MNFKNRTWIFIFLCLISSSITADAQSKGYRLTVRLHGLEEGSTVVSRLWNNKGYYSWQNCISCFQWDTAYVKNGEFQFNGWVPDGGPRRYWISFCTGPGKDKALELWIDNGENILITAPGINNINDVNHYFIQHHVNIEGSPSNYAKMCLEPARFLYSQTILKLNQEITRIQDSVGFDGPLIDKIISAKATLNSSFYIGLLSPDDYRDQTVLKSNAYLYTEFEFSGHAAFWMNVYNGLDDKAKNTYHGRWLKEIATLSVGQPFPTFDLPSPDGKKLQLKNIVEKGKITIVHLWSANSKERRIRQNEIRALYNMYHAKGLNVVTVFYNAMSNKPEGKYIDALQQWKDNLKSEQFPWHNVADIKGADGPTDRVYRAAANNETTNIVLDGNGKILAWGVQGSELQYYLWKHLGD